MLFPCSFPAGKIKRRNKEGRFLLYSFSVADRLCWESCIPISWDILMWQKKGMAWYQQQLSVEWGSQNVWKDGVTFSLQYFGMLCRLTIVSQDILASCWGWMGRVVRGCLERFGGTAVLGAALLRLGVHPRVPSQIGAAWGRRLRGSRSRVECPRHGFRLTVFVAAARWSRLMR